MLKNIEVLPEIIIAHDCKNPFCGAFFPEFREQRQEIPFQKSALIANPFLQCLSPPRAEVAAKRNAVNVLQRSAPEKRLICPLVPVQVRGVEEFHAIVEWKTINKYIGVLQAAPGE